MWGRRRAKLPRYIESNPQNLDENTSDLFFNAGNEALSSALAKKKLQNVFDETDDDAVVQVERVR